MEELLHELPLPTFQQFIFVQVALFTALMALLVVVARNLFHSALSLVGTLFGVAGIYAILEAEFLAVSQVLVYVGGISTLITFAIMLTRSMMFGDTAPINRQAGTAAIIIGTLFSVLAGLVVVIPWPGPDEAIGSGMPISDVAAIIAGETSTELVVQTAVANNGIAEAEAELEELEAELTSLGDAPSELDLERLEARIAEAQEMLTNSQELLASSESGIIVAPELGVVAAEEDEAEAAEETATEPEDSDTSEAEAELEAAVNESDSDDGASEEDAISETVIDGPADEPEEAAADAVEAETDIVIAEASVEQSSLAPIVRGERSDGEVIIARLGQMFVTTYLVPFELMALLLLVVLAGAIMLARDRV